MLETLAIRNIAIIDSAEISFKEGLNILSGETGAGKSIVIEAISLLLGSRAKAELIRSGAEEATVEGLFNISEVPWIRARLEKLGFDDSESDLLIKRTIHSGGRHKIFVNGQLCTLALLQELSEDLVDLCGQHEHQSLTKPRIQLDLLDRYGGLEKQATALSMTYHELRSLENEREKLAAAESERTKREDFLKFQLEELRAAELQEGEEESLQQEKQLLQTAEARVQAAEAARQILESEDGGTLNTLRGALSKLRALEQLDERSRPMTESLERAMAEAEDVSLSLNRYLASVDLNTERLESIQDRLSLIADFRRKYGATVADMLETQATLEKEYAELGGAEEKLAELTKRAGEVRGRFVAEAKKLSAVRRKAAEKLASEVTAQLKDLKMADAVFAIELTERKDPADWNATGSDDIQFLVQTNRGEASRPLGKIASGGELSRLMLAIRRVISDKGGIGVYLFDEIDAGIGGQVAFQVGKKLKSVAKTSQVLCITHLPQVASFADHHLVVRKSAKGKRTLTEVIPLSLAERKEELARMLGGPELTKKSLENASELLQLAKG